ncbi:MAG: tetratricopeptide repeat protein [Kofleriaceae bacterium]|nr:tetratricopeptide repeat protein [Kofleriaceae bacterium]
MAGTLPPKPPPPLPPAQGRRAASAPAGQPPTRPSGRFEADPAAVHGGVRGVRSVMVGRTAQLATLHDAVAQATDFAAPQLVTICGNQGTGKSRLIAELVLALRDRAGVAVRSFHGRARKVERASDRGVAVASLLRDRFGLTDDVVRNRERFTAVISDVVGVEQVGEMSYLLGGLVGLDFPPSSFLRVITEHPRQKADLVKTALIRFFELDAQRGPLLLILDDMHVADDETLQLVTAIASGLVGSPVVLLVAARPELMVRSTAWRSSDLEIDHVRIELRNLEPDDAETLFRNLLSRCGVIPDDIAAEAVEKTGGNPLFIEQLVRLLHDNGAIDSRGPVWRLDADRLADTELPISIEEAIESRVAALEGEERDLLERAAVFGNVFWLSAVIAMSRSLGDGPKLRPLEFEWEGGEPVRRRLSDLVAILAERDYLLPLDQDDSSIAGDTEIVFKHNLERELIIRTTEPKRLATLHLAAAQWLEAKTTGKTDEQLEFLAGLYERGSEPRRAAQCYIAAADRARSRYSPTEARPLYERALVMLGANEAPLRLDVLHNLGDVLEQDGRSDDAMQRFGEMLELAWLFDNLGKAGAAYARLGRGWRRLGRYDYAMEHLRRAQELFGSARDDRGVGAALDDMGQVHWMRGAYGQALDYHRQALTIRRALGDRRSIALSLANIGRVHNDSGNFKAAIAQFREALDLRREIGDMVGVVQSLGDLAGVHVADGQARLAADLLGEARTLAKETGDKLALAEVLSRSGEAQALLNASELAVADLLEARHAAASLGDRMLLALTHGRLAMAYLARGANQPAEIEAEAAITVSEAAGLRVQVGWGHRILAEVYAAQGQVPRADENFRKSIDVLVVVRHELELARAYRSFGALKHASGLAAEGQKLVGKADEIFARLRGAAVTE